jgi:hypothetical protein
MDNTRPVDEAAHVAGNQTSSPERNEISEPSRKRVLTMEAVMDDMRTILWPSECSREQRGK